MTHSAAKVYFIGAGPGAVDLITVRGAEILRSAGRIVYAGSLVNTEIITTYAREGCEVFDSSGMTLDEITGLLSGGHEAGILTVRLHSGDPAIFGAVREQMNILRERGIPFETVPGVSSLFAASSALKTEYMIPGGTQTLIITRAEGRTPVPKTEGLSSLASHGASMAVFLSAGMCETVCSELRAGGYDGETPAAVVYRASWPDERVIRGTLSTLPELTRGITKSAIILAGDFLNDNSGSQSKLYDKNFSHEYRCGIH
ncbi:MAG: precorrin-4 C(11)-methyltransferase [Synergistaceae bacterium]|nr:precorrin-4 C(11)-methyltransferase [Synergistaceae bacterium]